MRRSTEARDGDRAGGRHDPCNVAAPRALGNDDYPPIGDRLEAMIGGYNLPDASPFWIFTACLLIALMREDGRRLDYTGSSFRDFVMALLADLR